MDRIRCANCDKLLASAEDVCTACEDDNFAAVDMDDSDLFAMFAEEVEGRRPNAAVVLAEFGRWSVEVSSIEVRDPNSETAGRRNSKQLSFLFARARIPTDGEFRFNLRHCTNSIESSRLWPSVSNPTCGHVALTDHPLAREYILETNNAAKLSVFLSKQVMIDGLRERPVTFELGDGELVCTALREHPAIELLWQLYRLTGSSIEVLSSIGALSAQEPGWRL